jgi:hypothetical protein
MSAIVPVRRRIGIGGKRQGMPAASIGACIDGKSPCEIAGAFAVGRLETIAGANYCL